MKEHSGYCLLFSNKWKNLFLILMASVLFCLAAGTAQVSAQCNAGEYPVDLILLDQNGVQKAYSGDHLMDMNGEITTDSGTYIVPFAVRAPLRDKTTDQIVGYGIAELPQDGLKSTGKQTVCLQFKTGNSHSQGDPISYDPSLHYIHTTNRRELRLVHNINAYYTPPLGYNEWNPDQGNNISDTAPLGYNWNGTNAYANRGEITLKETKPLAYYVNIVPDQAGLTLTDADEVYVRVSNLHQSNNYTYACQKVTADYLNADGSYTVPITQWYTDANCTNPSDDTFTGNEKEVKTELTVKVGTAHFGIVENSGAVNKFEVVSYSDVTAEDQSDRSSTETDTSVNYYDTMTLKKHVPEKKLDPSLESLLSTYNFVTICDPAVSETNTRYTNVNCSGTVMDIDPGELYMADKHLMGGVIIRGKFDGTHPFAADSGYLTEPSYVGILPPVTSGDQLSINGRNHNANPPVFYIGEDNTVYTVKLNADIGDVVNGVHYTNGVNRHGATYVSTDYVDWDAVNGSVTRASNAMAAKGTHVTITADGQTVEVHGGTNTVIENPNNYLFSVKFTDIPQLDDPEALPTVVSILDTGSEQDPVKLPMITSINGKEAGGFLSSACANSSCDIEDGLGMSILWNFPNARVVTCRNQSPEVGHIIAPKALVLMDNNSQFNGGVISNAAFNNAEGHVWAYKGKKGSLTPTEVGFTVQKKLDGSIPETSGQFTFLLDELTGGEWVNIDTRTDASGLVSFIKIEYDSAATHWYRISEKTTDLPENITGDDSWYIVRVVVTEIVDEVTEDISYEEEHTVYKVKADQKDSLLNNDGTINESARKENR